MFSKCFREYANFLTRSRRKEYWIYVLIQSVINAVLVAVFFAYMGVLAYQGVINPYMSEDQLCEAMISSPLLWAYFTFLTAFTIINYPACAVTVRRLHDIGKSAWWLLIGYIPIIGWIWFLVLMCLDSQPGANQWGPNPKTEPLAPVNQIGLCGYYYKKAFRNYFNFTGKTDIAEYFGFNFVANIVFFLISLAVFIVGLIRGDSWLLMFLVGFGAFCLYCLAIIIPALALGARRLRDANLSPWLLLLYLAGNIGPLIVYILLCQPTKRVPEKEPSYDWTGSPQ